ncbi:PREDICTED: sterile alpha motif domain-containing protein 7 [Elephantulus edwardii]|uniref:sterile alpha motif domain-containing protein 7 n=1 Tax=Elephantulus edwardii TaxID=28737 RepID=UPI0003F0E516|nr:PREDICTED: sterile alpha motif domain-containing protein 7 [Elephantulus edwardii]
MAVNPLLTISRQQKTPVGPSPYELRTVERTEMEMYAVYQQRRMEKFNRQGLAGVGIPFVYGSCIPAGTDTFPGRSVPPAHDLHFHRSSLRNLQGNPMLVATGSHFLDSWEQKYRRLRRGTGSQKVLHSDTCSSKSQAEFKTLGQTQTNPHEEGEFAKDAETETVLNRKPSETNEKPAPAPAQSCGELGSLHPTPWAAPSSSLDPKAWDSGKEKGVEQTFTASSEQKPSSPSILPACELASSEKHLSLDEDINKWTVEDVHTFISGLPGCAGYAQVFKDHAIDGETLPLLTEDHLRDTMGIKLGPALKIQSQVSQRMGSMFYKKSLSFPIHTYSTKQAFDQPEDTSSPLNFNSWSETPSVPCSQDIIPKGIEPESHGREGRGRRRTDPRFVRQWTEAGGGAVTWGRHLRVVSWPGGPGVGRPSHTCAPSGPPSIPARTPHLKAARCKQTGPRWCWDELVAPRSLAHDTVSAS